MKQHRMLLLVLAVTVVAFLCSACSHALNVKNINTYRTLGLGHVEKQVSMGVATDTTDPVEGEYVRSVCRALQSSGCASRLLFPYNLSLHSTDPKAEIIVNISPSIDYSGSGWNFLINWPGFLIFTPAWNGYIYHADMDFMINLTDGRTNKPIDSFTVPIRFNIRHAAMNRTWTEIGWLEVGVIPLIGAFCFIQYDDNVTELLLQKVKDDVGIYVAERIVARIGSYMSGGGTARRSVYESPVAKVIEISIPRISYAIGSH